MSNKITFHLLVHENTEFFNFHIADFIRLWTHMLESYRPKVYDLCKLDYFILLKTMIHAIERKKNVYIPNYIKHWTPGSGIPRH